MFIQEEDRPPQGTSFRRRLLGGLAVTLYRYPFLSALSLIGVTVLAGWGAARLDVQLSLRVSVEPDARERAVWEQMSMVAPPHSPVTAVIKAPKSLDSEARERVERLLVEAWSDPAFVASVTRIPPRERAKPSELFLSYEEILTRLRPEDLGLLEPLATDPGRVREVLVETWGEAAEKWEALSTETLSARASDPFRLLEALRARGDAAPGPLPASLPPASYVEPSARKIVLVLHPARPASDFFYCLRLKRFLEQTVETLAANPPDEIRGNVPGFEGIKLRLFGRHIDTALTATKFRIDMARSLSVLAVCTMLLLVLAFRKLESFLFILLPPAFALIWTYGLVSLFTRELNLIAAVFPFLMIGFGVEFVVQIYHRFVEELYRESRFYPALRTAYAEAGRGIITSSLATALIFFSLQFSGFRPLREIALVGGLGTVSMALAALLLLPPLAAIKSRLAEGKVMPLETWDFALGDVSAAVISSPRATLALGLLITAYLAYHAREAGFNESLGLDMGAPQTLSHRAIDPDSPNLHLADAPISILLEAPSRQEALGLNDRLYANLLRVSGPWRIGAIRSLSPALPSEAVQNAVRGKLVALDLDGLARSFRVAAQTLRVNPKTFEPFAATLRGLRRFAETAPLVSLESSTDETLLETAQRHLLEKPLGRGYRILTTVFPKDDSPLVSQADFEAFRSEVSRGLPANAPRWFQSETQQNRLVAQTVFYSMALMAVLSIVSLVVCLFPHFQGRLTDVLLAMTPLVCATVWTLGLLSILRLEVGLYALLALPLVIGYAINQATLFIQRLHDRQYATLRQVMRSGGRPGVISGVVLGIGLGCLALVRFRPMQEMALAAGIAVCFSTLSTLVLIPAILQVREEGGLSGWNAESED